MIHKIIIRRVNDLHGLGIDAAGAVYDIKTGEKLKKEKYVGNTVYRRKGATERISEKSLFAGCVKRSIVLKIKLPF